MSLRDKWLDAYFAYCCLEYSGRFVLRQLLSNTQQALSEHGITMDLDLQHALQNGTQLKFLGVTEEVDVWFITDKFLNSRRGIPTELTSAWLSDVYNNCCYAWYTLTRKLSPKCVEYLKIMRLLTKAQARELLGEPQATRQYQFELMRLLKESNVRNLFYCERYYVKDAQGSDVYSVPWDLTQKDTSTKNKKVIAMLTTPPYDWEVLTDAIKFSIDDIARGISDVIDDNKNVTDLKSFMEATGLPEYVARSIFDYVKTLTPESFGICDILMKGK